MKPDRRKELLDELQGTRCGCGNNKAAKQTFCRGCYFRLPEPMRKALYNRFGEGYEEAYSKAVTFLRS